MQPKYFINNTNFPQGFVTPDDSWDNHWRSGAELRCWAGVATLPGSGNGAKSLGMELESSAAFASCQVTRVFKYVCLRAPNSAADFTQVNHDDRFVPSRTATRCGRSSLKRAAYCMGN